MKRLSKAILVTFGVLVAFGIAALVGLNLYVQSPGTQTRLQDALSKALGLPLAITSTSISPWGSVKINGVRVPTAEGNFLEATGFSARYRLLGLVQRRLEIRDLRAESPKIVWRQNAEGKYELPRRPRDFSKKPDDGEKKDSSSGFTVVIDGFKLLHGQLEFIDKDQQLVASFRDVELDYHGIAEERPSGSVSIGSITWKKLVVSEVRSPFTYAAGDLNFPTLEGAVAGGTLRTNLTVKPNGSEVPFTAAVQIEAVDLGRLMTETGWAPEQFAGEVAGTLNAKGRLRKIIKTEGPGTLTLTRGRVRQLGLFQTIGEVLQIPELADLRLEPSRAEFHLKDEKVNIDALALNSRDVQITGKGPVRFSGKLGLEARLAFSERTAKQLPDFVRTNFTKTDATGLEGLDFKVSGTLEKPKTDLLDRVIGGKLTEQFNDIFSTFLGRKKDKDEDKKKEDKKKAAEALSRTPPPPPPALDPTATTVVPPADAAPAPKPPQP